MWSASITMMHGFQGRVDKDDAALKMVRLFILMMNKQNLMTMWIISYTDK